MYQASIIFSGVAWWLPVAGLLIALAGALIWSGHRSATDRSVRIGCSLLKITGIALIAAALLEPLWVSQKPRPGANVFAIVADNSRSLQVKDPGAPASRGELLQQKLTGQNERWQSALEETFQVRRYRFDSRLQNTKDFNELRFDGSASSLVHALKTAAENWRGQPVAGVLLFTDGNSTDLKGDLPALEGSPPVYPVVLGQDAPLQDVSLTRVAVSQTSFEDAPVTVQARATAGNLSGTPIVARLTEIATGSSSVETNSGASQYQVTMTTNVVAESTQRAVGDDAEVNFRMQVQPEGPGLHFYELDTRMRSEADGSDASSREATLYNNRQLIVVDRGQDPFRVLYVSGRPNWEFKFLNRAVQEDRQVQLVALIRAAPREPKYQFKGRAGESSNPLYRGFGREGEDAARYDQPVLIRLNTRDEFELRGGFPKTAEELFQYQAVIVDDTEAEFFTHEQMALLQRFVSERGGGFLMLGGADSFREGGYAETPLASILPVYLDRNSEPGRAGPWKLSLTRDGWLQPWARLRTTEQEEKNRLETLPGMEVLNRTHTVKPGASVLATVTDSSGETVPALVVQRFGRGRSAALMIGDLWKTGLQDEAMQADLAKSWRQTVRWLVADVPGQVTVATKDSGTGDPTHVRLVVQARNKEFQPLDNASVELAVRLIKSSADDGNHADGPQPEVRLAAEPVAAQPGFYEATYVAREPGAYSVVANVRDSEGALAGRAVTGWASDPSAEEFRTLKPNRTLLETIARKTGGEVIGLDRLESFARGLPRREAPVMETTTTPLWHMPAVFLVVLGCFVAEWGIRRWKGLP